MDVYACLWMFMDVYGIFRAFACQTYGGIMDECCLISDESLLSREGDAGYNQAA